MNDLTRFSRRDFLKAGTLLGGGLVIGFVVPGAKRFAQAAAPAAAAGKLPQPNAFLRIAADDSVTVQIAHSEMGQGIWTTLPMLIAEELDADWSRMKVEHAPAAPAYAHTMFGMQMTGGSSSTWSEFERYRQAGAMARALLVQAAAQRFGVKPADCRTENGVVICGAQRARYGELAEAAAALPTPTTVVLKEAKDWKLIGKATKRLDSPEKITGRAAFGIDIQFPGLLTAVVARPPVFGASVKSFDASKARAVLGVRDVVQVPSGVAVVADHFWAAKLGRDALAIDWNPGPNAALDTASLEQEFSRLADTRGMTAAKAGDAAGRRLPRALSGPCADGAAELRGEDRGRPLRDLDRHAVPDDGPDGRGADRRPEAGAGADSHHLPRRRLRSARDPDLGFRQRGGAGCQGGRQAGQDGVDPRG